jgi:F-type H+-transporting ATPase subunit epsilon
MNKLFQVNIISAQKSVFKGQVSLLIVPAALGYLGVLANHDRLIANLIPGKIIFKEDSGKQSIIYSQGKGFLEVLRNNATLLLDDIKMPQ